MVGLIKTKENNKNNKTKENNKNKRIYYNRPSLLFYPISLREHL